VLIAFVIIAAAFSFMVINQGLFATERGKTVIQEGLKQASTPLTVDGTTFIRTQPDGKKVDVIIIPVKAFGVKYVPMGREQTVITLRIGEKAWANMYYGVLYNSSNPSQTYDPTSKEFDEFVAFQVSGDVSVHGSYGAGNLTTGVVLAIANTNNDEALDTGEKGYLIITLATEDAASARDEISVEIRLEKSATLSIEFSVPESMPQNSYVPV
jgi:flagellin FlaB